MVITFISQLYRTTIFPVQFWMTDSDHLFNKCDQNIRHVKNQIIILQIPEGKLKQLGLWNYCLVFSNSWSVLLDKENTSTTWHLG